MKDYEDQIKEELKHMDQCGDPASKLRATIILCALAIIDAVRVEGVDVVNAVVSNQD